MLTPPELVGFLKALCRYYSDFLETDFHASRSPSRQLTLRGRKGQLLGFDLGGYPDFANRTLRALLGRFEKPLPPIIRKDEVEESVSTEILEGERPSLYRQTFEIYKNRELLDKHNTYLYFFPFTAGDVTYPLVFVPVDVELSEIQDRFTIEPAPVIYINVKALRHVATLLSERFNTRWSIDVPDRQLFLGSLSDRDLTTELQRLLNALTDFNGSRALNVSDLGSSSKGEGLRLDIGVHLVVASQGDEALVTDYEELLKRLQVQPDDESITGMLAVLDDFLFQNPPSITSEVEEELASEPMTTRISYPSPIPLNQEQMLITRALRKSECQRVVIEGPPGTGKSHTITALVFEALRDGKSILLVSDKKEALDVVEDKINDVLDASKMDDTFQNPILRLGAKTNNFAKIFYEGNLVKIRARQSALRDRSIALDGAVAGLQDSIAQSAQADVAARLALHSADAAEALAFERRAGAFLERLDSAELDRLGHERLRDLSQATMAMRESIAALKKVTQLTKPGSFDKLYGRLRLTQGGLTQLAELDVAESRFLADASPGAVAALAAMPSRVLQCRKPLLGYLLSRQQLELLKLEILNLFPNSGVGWPQEHLVEMTTDARLFQNALALAPQLSALRLDPLSLLKESRVEPLCSIIGKAIRAFEAFRDAYECIPVTAGRLGLSLGDLSSLSESDPYIAPTLIEDYLAYWRRVSTLRAVTGRSQPAMYLHQRDELQKRLTLTMSSLLDRAVLRFNEEHKADAVTIRKLIKERKQIPRNLLPAPANAFPCIIIGIRELGSYIPFEFGVFDLVVIDEASQVSVAQALPAILRAKKCAVLGDPRQFSNVKAAFASGELNTAAFSRVRSALAEALKEKDRGLSRHYLDKATVFNIKTSVLEFVRYLANYTGFLRKHFRGYNELIDYSNETFYQRMLQVMKIRSRPISEVINFEIVDASGAPSVPGENSNETEADFILSRLDELISDDFQGTVAVITPFTDQQNLIFSRAFRSENARAFRSKLRLKVMTFDTSQGEERDLIIYSMVERPGENTLRFIFPTSLSAAQLEEEGDLKKQRLNVGFSRAKESVLFVLSKPLSDFLGEAGRALRAFETQRRKPDFASIVLRTDPKSPKEPEILQLISQTTFYRENEAFVEIQPQFPIGDLIKQLDPLANIPSYVSDFLLIYSPPGERPRRAIIEYDGVEAHFMDAEHVNAFNYDVMRSERDVERMRTIESYGYPMISLNKFMLGRNPVQVIDSALNEAFKKKVLTTIHA